QATSPVISNIDVSDAVSECISGMLTPTSSIFSATYPLESPESSRQHRRFDGSSQTAKDVNKATRCPDPPAPAPTGSNLPIDGSEPLAMEHIASVAKQKRMGSREDFVSQSRNNATTNSTSQDMADTSSAEVSDKKEANTTVPQAKPFACPIC